MHGCMTIIDYQKRSGRTFKMLKTIDLFAGAGGLSLGFQHAGEFKLLAAAEINNNAQATYKANIAKECTDFIFIDDVVGYDFSLLNEKLRGIDVVIGGPPCQGFSNANRQKNHFISTNNDLIKHFFRAIKEIRPKAFIMENVNMLRSDTHRFYESRKDSDTIMELNSKGFDIPKKIDSIRLGWNHYEGINLANIYEIDFEKYTIPADLLQLLSVLKKNLFNPKRLPKFLEKNTSSIILSIDKYVDNQSGEKDEAVVAIISRLVAIKDALLNNTVKNYGNEIDYIVSLHKLISTINEIKHNEIIGEYCVEEDGRLIFTTHSYSVIDYITAILGGEYTQAGNTLNAKWFGVPQDRKRYIIMGIRKDLFPNVTLELPQEPEKLKVPTVGEAILDLQEYEVGYEPEYEEVPYRDHEVLSPFARLMRENSTSVKNHITTKTRSTALERFKAIEPGENFHSLSIEMKSTYSKPERTQNTIYLRLNSNEPSSTVVNVRKSMWIHPTLNRAISVREAARLQSFPDEFEFIGTKDSQYQQVGNAVPPLLAKGIAEYLLSKIRK